MSKQTAADQTIKPLGAWCAPRLDLSAALAEPVCARLGELGVIEVAGPDADAFLHGQLTNSCPDADYTIVRNGYCTPKGRLLAVFEHWRVGTIHYLQLPREILPPLLKRLSMYVLRAKVQLADVSHAWTSYGVIGPGSIDVLKQVGLIQEGPAVNDTVRAGELCIWRQHDGTLSTERLLIVGPCDQLPQALGNNFRTVDSGVWFWSQIDAGVPTVIAKTQEKYLPQMIHLEVLKGVDFKKGCYPGQEIVARSQYLGKLKRRMHLAHVLGTAHAGDDVLDAGTTEAVGSVILAACAPDGGSDLLFECPIQIANGESTISLSLPSGTALNVRALPYEVTDVTA